MRIAVSLFLFVLCALVVVLSEGRYAWVARLMWMPGVVLWAYNLQQAWQCRHRGPRGLYVPRCPCSTCVRTRVEEPGMTEKFDEAVASGRVRIVEFPRRK
jgi:hypothetical protein